jgi:GTP-binding protein
VFIKSATKESQYTKETAFEIAFVGRSNAGKSSLINTLANNRKLCKIGKTPGKTRLINFFAVNSKLTLVDLPGYGFANASKVELEKWKIMIEEYLTTRKSLKMVVIVMDVRHYFKPSDEEMARWCIHFNIPIHFCLTKADKLSKMQASISLQKFDKNQIFKQNTMNITAQLISSSKRTGVDELKEIIAKTIEVST